MVGRKREREMLQEAYQSSESEFAVVYGRRRVGKTYLVRETFNGRFAFQHTGVLRANRLQQLVYFRDSLIDAGWNECPPLQDWHDAFRQLQKHLENSPKGRKVVFLDELPYMVTRKSDCLTALDHFWNAWASARNDILLIVCGSAASWLLDRLVLNKGGLHNRVTLRIPLAPFTLAECKQYADEKQLGYNYRQLAECYMALGGIPFYWKPLRKGLSVAQNMDALFFADAAILKNEYDELYASLFESPEQYMKIVETLGKTGRGLSRDEISAASGIPSSGTLTKLLADLEKCGFIGRFQSYGKTSRDIIYRLMDNYSLFYFQFVKDNTSHDEQFWVDSVDTPLHHAWAGLAFERLGLQHVRQIKAALGIAGVKTTVSTWRHTADEDYPKGAQIDLLIDRADGLMNICEMKFSEGVYAMDKKEHEALLNRRSAFAHVTKTKKGLHLTMVTAEGMLHNAYWNDIHSEVTLDDLFRE